MVLVLLWVAEAIILRPAVQRLNDSVNWPKTPGVIRATGLKLYLNKAHMAPSYTPTVVYNYTADGIPRTNTRIDYSDWKLVLGKEAALRWLETNYPVGKAITVYYDPTDPDAAVLTPGAPDWVFICNWAMGLTAGCGFASAILYRRARRADDVIGVAPRILPM